MPQQKLNLLEIHPLDRRGIFPKLSAGEGPGASFLFGWVFLTGGA